MEARILPGRPKKRKLRGLSIYETIFGAKKRENGQHYGPPLSSQVGRATERPIPVLKHRSAPTTGDGRRHREGEAQHFQSRNSFHRNSASFAEEKPLPVRSAQVERTRTPQASKRTERLSVVGLSKLAPNAATPVPNDTTADVDGIHSSRVTEKPPIPLISKEEALEKMDNVGSKRKFRRLSMFRDKKGKYLDNKDSPSMNGRQLLPSIALLRGRSAPADYEWKGPGKSQVKKQPAALELIHEEEKKGTSSTEELLEEEDLTGTETALVGKLVEDVQDEASIEETYMAEALKRTQIMTLSELPITQSKESPLNQDHIVSTSDLAFSEANNCNCATAILKHSYFEMMFCGSQDAAGRSIYSRPYGSTQPVPDDPTVQESIECVFASQLEDGVAYSLLDDDESAEVLSSAEQDLASPSILHQTLVRNRSHQSIQPPLLPTASHRSTSSIQKKIVHGSLEYIGSFDPSQARADECQVTSNEEPSASVPSQCQCSHQCAPSIDPEQWPQRPLFFRATPGSGTRIKGIRFAGEKDYLWDASKETLTWPDALLKHWGLEPKSSSSPLRTLCPQCMVLPINNGNETRGETLVTDFETDLFEGSILLRLRFSEGTTRGMYNDNVGYFAGMNRRYQTVIQGKFKSVFPFTECVTGFELERPCGKLPPKWIVNGALKVVSFFAPQLQARLDGPRPSSLTPLGSTPQCVVVRELDDLNIEQKLVEPDQDASTLLGDANKATSSMQRARHRKKLFDKLYTHKSPEPATDPTKVYTFEFLQHLFNFTDFSIELGSMLGSIKLKEILDGQPLQIMATHGSRKIWSFEVWHEALFEDARKHDKRISPSEFVPPSI